MGEIGMQLTSSRIAPSCCRPDSSSDHALSLVVDLLVLGLMISCPLKAHLANGHGRLIVDGD